MENKFDGIELLIFITFMVSTILLIPEASTIALKALLGFLIMIDTIVGLNVVRNLIDCIKTRIKNKEKLESKNDIKELENYEIEKVKTKDYEIKRSIDRKNIVDYEFDRETEQEKAKKIVMGKRLG